MCSMTFVTNSKEGLALLLHSALGGLGGFKSNPMLGQTCKMSPSTPSGMVLNFQGLGKICN